MLINKYTSHLAFDDTVQDMEFVGLKHLLLCVDMTKRTFHFLYQHENPCDEFLDSLKHSKHKIVGQKEISISLEESGFNDLCFSLYDTDDGGIAVFDGLAVIGNEEGIHIVEHPNIISRKVPPSELLMQFNIDVLDSDSCYLRCDIPIDNLAVLALKMENLDYKIFDDIYRGPGELIDFEERIISVQRYYSGPREYFHLTAALKNAEESLCVDNEAAQDLLPMLSEISDSLGLDLSLFDDTGNRKMRFD